MTSQVTQCPKCQTSFRVTQTQLTIANGAVRCGSCLHIFNAPDHWLSSAPTPKAVSTASAIATDDKKRFSESNQQHDLEAIFEDGNDAIEIGDNNFDISDDVDSNSLPSITIDNSDDDILLDDDNDDLPQYNDTGMNSKLIFDDDMSDTDNRASSSFNSLPKNKFSDSFISLDADNERSSSVYKEFDDLGDMDNNSSEKWLENLLEDQPEEEQMLEETPDIFHSLSSTALPLPEVDLENDRATEEHNDFLFEPSKPIEDAFILGDRPMVAGEPIGNKGNSLLASIEPEPVVFSFKKDRSHWKTRGWLILIFAAATVYAAQYAVFNFESLSRDKQTRPWVKWACNHIGCQLPELDDVRLITSSNLMVRSHPRIENALVVDAIITNRASFQQNFPIMELQFTNLAGDIVASRRFSPSQYLAGELTGANIMPTRQPIHVSLEIVDPGKNAMNYQLYFHPGREG